jgi:hypothetical protein
MCLALKYVNKYWISMTVKAYFLKGSRIRFARNQGCLRLFGSLQNYGTSDAVKRRHTCNIRSVCIEIREITVIYLVTWHDICPIDEMRFMFCPNITQCLVPSNTKDWTVTWLDTRSAVPADDLVVLTNILRWLWLFVIKVLHWVQPY